MFAGIAVSNSRSQRLVIVEKGQVHHAPYLSSVAEKIWKRKKVNNVHEKSKLNPDAKVAKLAFLQAYPMAGQL